MNKKTAVPPPARFRKGPRSSRDPPLAPRELAAVLLQLCALGTAQRVRGCCLGSGLVNRVELSDGAVRLTPPRSCLEMRAQRRSAHRHALRRHDSGCEAIGVSLQEAETLLQRLDGFGAAQLFMEAFHDAVVEILRADGRLGESELVEIVDVHLGRRITPVPLPTS